MSACSLFTSPHQAPWAHDLHLLFCRYDGLVAKLCLTFGTQWTVACQAPMSMDFSRQEHWSGLPFPSPGPRDQTLVSCIANGLLHCKWSPALQANSLLTEPSGKPEKNKLNSHSHSCASKHAKSLQSRPTL